MPSSSKTTQPKSVLPPCILMEMHKQKVQRLKLSPDTIKDAVKSIQADLLDIFSGKSNVVECTQTLKMGVTTREH